MTKKNDSDLLDTLHDLTECEYMSDLKSDALRARLLQVMSEMDVAAFPLEEWEKAVSYLFSVEPRFHSPGDVREFIKAGQNALTVRKKGAST